MTNGTEGIVEASGCRAESLGISMLLEDLFNRIISD